MEIQLVWSISVMTRTCIIGYKCIWVPKLLGVSDPKYPKIVIFLFAILRICIVFVNISTFPHDNWICIRICGIWIEFSNYFSGTVTKQLLPSKDL